MDDHDWLAARFEEKRSHLRDVAYRMLGSAGDAEDAVQETWLRLTRMETAAVTNLGGWLTTVTARVCLDMLRARRIRRAAVYEEARTPDDGGDPAREALLADSVGVALFVVLETLSPVERVAFVLHDLFDLPFDEVARIVDRSEAATRQIASRARRRVQRREMAADDGRAARAVVDAFLAASRAGDFDGLLAVLDPDVVLRSDARTLRVARAATKWGEGSPPIERDARGAETIARMFVGRAGGATRATIDGEAGAAWVVKGRVRSAFVFTIANGRIAALDLIMEPDAVAELDIALVT